MRIKSRYILMNGGGLVLKRRWPWWKEYESYDNHKIAQHHKILAAVEKLKKEVAKLDEIESTERKLKKEIADARDCPKNTGPIKSIAYKLKDLFCTSKKDQPPAPNGWEPFVLFVRSKGQTTLAGMAAGSIGANVTHVNGQPVDGRDGSDGGEKPIREVVSAEEHPIRPEKKGQQKPQRGQNNQQQQ